MALIPRSSTSRSLAAGEHVVGRVDRERPIQLTIHVKPAGDSLARDVSARAAEPLRAAAPLTRSDYAKAYGAKPSDINRIRRFADEYGFRVVPDHLARALTASPLAQRTVELRGTVGDANHAFGIQLMHVHGVDGSVYRTYLGQLSVPSEYDDAINDVFGLDTRPQVSPRSVQSYGLGGTQTTSVSYTPIEVAKAYGFPPSVSGKGQTIAILEMGGGYRMRDLRRYFKGLGVRVPRIRAINVAGARNAPTGDPNGPDSEVMLDIEVAGAIANGADFVVYFAPNTNRGFFKGVNAAVHDNVHKPMVLSISWGGPEGSWTQADMTSITEAFQAAASMGVSVFVAAGDSGCTDGVKGTAPHCDFPASSPWATGCGGTYLQAGPPRFERVWNDADNGGSGGGISTAFSVPSYQVGLAYASMPLNGRGVPDVAGCADPNSGYKVRIDGVNTVYGGTSAVAPLWSALTALLIEARGKPLGFLNPLLYQTSMTGSGGAPLGSALYDITQGNNDTTGRINLYNAGVGWDPCSGYGTPTPQAITGLLGAP